MTFPPSLTRPKENRDTALFKARRDIFGLVSNFLRGTCGISLTFSGGKKSKNHTRWNDSIALRLYFNFACSPSVVLLLSPNIFLNFNTVFICQIVTGRRAPQADRDRGAGDPQEGEGAHVHGEAPGGGRGIQGADHRRGEEVRELAEKLETKLPNRELPHLQVLVGSFRSPEV